MDLEQPILDMQSAIDYSGADEAFVNELRQMLAEVLPEHRNNAVSYAQAKDWDNLAREAHKLHGALSYTGTPRLKDASKQLQLAAREQSQEHIQEQLELFLDTLDKTYEALGENQ